MKTVVLSAFLMFFIALSVFCNGNLELVNTQKIELDNIMDVKILYSSERVSLFMGTTNTLVIKEYMSENNSQYFANISKSGNIVTIENGRWPFKFLFNNFSRRLEVYLPLAYKNTTSIKTSSGNIEVFDLICSKVAIESSSGSISLSSITADTMNIKSTSGRINVGTAHGEISIVSSSGQIDINQATGIIISKASSGSIVFGTINGNVSAETSSGSIEFGLVTGSVNAKTTSGPIRCTVGESAGNITFNTTSGGVRLNLPYNLQFSFSSRTTSGSLTTPFSDRLSHPVTDRNLTQGIIGGNNASESIPTINIRTSSGFIKIEWI